MTVKINKEVRDILKATGKTEAQIRTLEVEFSADLRRLRQLERDGVPDDPNPKFSGESLVELADEG